MVHLLHHLSCYCDTFRCQTDTRILGKTLGRLYTEQCWAVRDNNARQEHLILSEDPFYSRLYRYPPHLKKNAHEREREIETICDILEALESDRQFSIAYLLV